MAVAIAWSAFMAGEFGESAFIASSIPSVSYFCKLSGVEDDLEDESKGFKSCHNDNILSRVLKIQMPLLLPYIWCGLRFGNWEF